MSEIVSTLWLMSIQASVLILVILAVRMLLRNYKKGYSYGLWFLVLVRLLCPVFIESSFSLQPDMPILIEMEKIPEANSNHQNGNHGAATPAAPDMPPMVNEMEQMGEAASKAYDLLHILRWGYLFGAAGFGIYFLVQYTRMRKKVAFAVRDKENVWLCSEITSPFVMGVLNPKIYLPTGISEEEKVHILRHEYAHIAHKDPFVRVVGSIALILHWWNPMVRYAIHKMNQDMEMFCDETALAEASMAERKAYSNSLLQFAMKQDGIALTLSFGESNTELRVRNILRKKKAGVVISFLVAIISVFCIILFLTVPENATENAELLHTEETEVQEKVVGYIFYTEPALESAEMVSIRSTIGLTEEQAEKLKSIIDGIDTDNWTDGDYAEGLPYYFDGAITFEDREYRYHFIYEDNIIYYDHYFAEISEEDMQYIKSIENTQVDVGYSEIYSRKDILDAIVSIKSEFDKEWDGCTLTEIYYAGDEVSIEYQSWADRNNADEVIVLLSSFEVDGSGGDGSLNPNSTYNNWKWILVRTFNGEWIHVDHGY